MCSGFSLLRCVRAWTSQQRINLGLSFSKSKRASKMLARGFSLRDCQARQKANKIIKRRADTVAHYSSMSTFRLTLNISRADGMNKKSESLVPKRNPRQHFTMHSNFSLPTQRNRQFFIAIAVCLRFEFQFFVYFELFFNKKRYLLGARPPLVQMFRVREEILHYSKERGIELLLFIYRAESTVAEF